MNRFEFRLASPEDYQKVEAFNQRLASAGENYHHLSLAIPFRTMAHLQTSPVIVEKFFCFEGGEIRGGVTIKRMIFQVNGAAEEVSCFVYPLSEGIINPDFASVWSCMQAKMEQCYPLMYTSGATKAKRFVRWFSRPIPFHFVVLQASPFLRNAVELRKRRWLRGLADAAAISGAGEIGLAIFKLLQRLLRRYPDCRGLHVERFDNWGEWADEIWHKARNRHTLIGDRSLAALQSLYPAENNFLIKLRISKSDTKQPIGWAILTLAKMKDHKYFGDMKLAALVDMLAVPEDAYAVVSGAVVAAQQAKADLMVTNHSDGRWNEAFERAGMLPWKTNFSLFLSPKLSERFEPMEDYASEFFFTRGDGHGPTSLWMVDYHSTELPFHLFEVVHPN